MVLSNIQAAIVAAVIQLITVAVTFALITSTEAAAITNAAVAVVNAAFLIGAAVENYGNARIEAANIQAGQ